MTATLLYTQYIRFLLSIFSLINQRKCELFFVILGFEKLNILNRF